MSSASRQNAYTAWIARRCGRSSSQNAAAKLEPLFCVISAQRRCARASRSTSSASAIAPPVRTQRERGFRDRRRVDAGAAPLRVDVAVLDEPIGQAEPPDRHAGCALGEQLEHAAAEAA